VLDVSMLAAALAALSLLVALPPELRGAGRAVAGLAAALAAGLYVAVFCTPLSIRVAGKVLPTRLNGPLIPVLERVSEGLTALRSPGRIALATAASAATWSLYVGVNVLYLPFTGLPMSLTAGLAILVASGVANAIPGPPGSIGTYHFACRFVLEALGVPAPTATAVAIATHAVNYLGNVGAGLVCYAGEVRRGEGRGYDSGHPNAADHRIGAREMFDVLGQGS